MRVFPTLGIPINVGLVWCPRCGRDCQSAGIALTAREPGRLPGGEHHKAQFLCEGEITINEVKCRIILPAPPPPSYTNVVVFQYPYERDNDVLVKELSAFGNVKDIWFQKWTNIPDVCTGTRIVRISLLKPIPRFILVQGV